MRPRGGEEGGGGRGGRVVAPRAGTLTEPLSRLEMLMLPFFAGSPSRHFALSRCGGWSGRADATCAYTQGRGVSTKPRSTVVGCRLMVLMKASLLSVS